MNPDDKVKQLYAVDNILYGTPAYNTLNLFRLFDSLHFICNSTADAQAYHAIKDQLFSSTLNNEIEQFIKEFGAIHLAMTAGKAELDEYIKNLLIQQSASHIRNDWPRTAVMKICKDYGIADELKKHFKLAANTNLNATQCLEIIQTAQKLVGYFDQYNWKPFLSLYTLDEQKKIQNKKMLFMYLMQNPAAELPEKKIDALRKIIPDAIKNSIPEPKPVNQPPVPASAAPLEKDKTKPVVETVIIKTPEPITSKDILFKLYRINTLPTLGHPGYETWKIFQSFAPIYLFCDSIYDAEQYEIVRKKLFSTLCEPQHTSAFVALTTAFKPVEAQIKTLLQQNLPIFNMSPLAAVMLISKQYDIADELKTHFNSTTIQSCLTADQCVEIIQAAHKLFGYFDHFKWKPMLAFSALDTQEQLKYKKMLFIFLLKNKGAALPPATIDDLRKLLTPAIKTTLIPTKEVAPPENVVKKQIEKSTNEGKVAQIYGDVLVTYGSAAYTTLTLFRIFEPLRLFCNTTNEAKQYEAIRLQLFNTLKQPSDTITLISQYSKLLQQDSNTQNYLKNLLAQNDIETFRYEWLPTAVMLISKEYALADALIGHYASQGAMCLTEKQCLEIIHTSEKLSGYFNDFKWKTLLHAQVPESEQIVYKTKLFMQVLERKNTDLPEKNIAALHKILNAEKKEDTKSQVNKPNLGPVNIIAQRVIAQTPDNKTDNSKVEKIYDTTNVTYGTEAYKTLTLFRLIDSLRYFCNTKTDANQFDIIQKSLFNSLKDSSQLQTLVNEYSSIQIKIKPTEDYVKKILGQQEAANIRPLWPITAVMVLCHHYDLIPVIQTAFNAKSNINLTAEQCLQVLKSCEEAENFITTFPFEINNIKAVARDLIALALKYPGIAQIKETENLTADSVLHIQKIMRAIAPLLNIIVSAKNKDKVAVTTPVKVTEFVHYTLKLYKTCGFEFEDETLRQLAHLFIYDISIQQNTQSQISIAIKMKALNQVPLIIDRLFYIYDYINGHENDNKNSFSFISPALKFTFDNLDEYNKGKISLIRRLHSVFIQSSKAFSIFTDAIIANQKISMEHLERAENAIQNATIHKNYLNNDDMLEALIEIILEKQKGANGFSKFLTTHESRKLEYERTAIGFKFPEIVKMYFEFCKATGVKDDTTITFRLIEAKRFACKLVEHYKNNNIKDEGHIFKVILYRFNNKTVDVETVNINFNKILQILNLKNDFSPHLLKILPDFVNAIPAQLFDNHLIKLMSDIDSEPQLQVQLCNLLNTLKTPGIYDADTKIKLLLNKIFNLDNKKRSILIKNMQLGFGNIWISKLSDENDKNNLFKFLLAHEKQEFDIISILEAYHADNNRQLYIWQWQLNNKLERFYIKCNTQSDEVTYKDYLIHIKNNIPALFDYINIQYFNYNQEKHLDKLNYVLGKVVRAFGMKKEDLYKFFSHNTLSPEVLPSLGRIISLIYNNGHKGPIVKIFNSDSLQKYKRHKAFLSLAILFIDAKLQNSDLTCEHQTIYQQLLNNDIPPETKPIALNNEDFKNIEPLNESFLIKGKKDATNGEWITDMPEGFHAGNLRIGKTFISNDEISDLIRKAVIYFYEHSKVVDLTNVQLLQDIENLEIKNLNDDFKIFESDAGEIKDFIINILAKKLATVYSLNEVLAIKIISDHISHYGIATGFDYPIQQLLIDTLLLNVRSSLETTTLLHAAGSFLIFKRQYTHIEDTLNTEFQGSIEVKYTLRPNGYILDTYTYSTEPNFKHTVEAALYFAQAFSVCIEKFKNAGITSERILFAIQKTMALRELIFSAKPDPDDQQQTKMIQASMDFELACLRPANTNLFSQVIWTQLAKALNITDDITPVLINKDYPLHFYTLYFAQFLTNNNIYELLNGTLQPFGILSVFENVQRLNILLQNYRLELTNLWTEDEIAYAKIELGLTSENDNIDSVFQRAAENKQHPLAVLINELIHGKMSAADFAKQRFLYYCHNLAQLMTNDELPLVKHFSAAEIVETIKTFFNFDDLDNINNVISTFLTLKESDDKNNKKTIILALARLITARNSAEICKFLGEFNSLKNTDNKIFIEQIQHWVNEYLVKSNAIASVLGTPDIYKPFVDNIISELDTTIYQEQQYSRTIKDFILLLTHSDNQTVVNFNTIIAALLQLNNYFNCSEEFESLRGNKLNTFDAQIKFIKAAAATYFYMHDHTRFLKPIHLRNVWKFWKIYKLPKMIKKRKFIRKQNLKQLSYNDKTKVFELAKINLNLLYLIIDAQKLDAVHRSAIEIINMTERMPQIERDEFLASDDFVCAVDENIDKESSFVDKIPSEYFEKLKESCLLFPRVINHFFSNEYSHEFKIFIAKNIEELKNLAKKLKSKYNQISLSDSLHIIVLNHYYFSKDKIMDESNTHNEFIDACIKYFESARKLSMNDTQYEYLFVSQLISVHQGFKNKDIVSKFLSNIEINTTPAADIDSNVFEDNKITKLIDFINIILLAKDKGVDESILSKRLELFKFDNHKDLALINAAQPFLNNNAISTEDKQIIAKNIILNYEHNHYKSYNLLDVLIISNNAELFLKYHNQLRSEIKQKFSFIPMHEENAQKHTIKLSKIYQALVQDKDAESCSQNIRDLIENKDDHYQIIECMWKFDFIIDYINQYTNKPRKEIYEAIVMANKSHLQQSQKNHIKNKDTIYQLFYISLHNRKFFNGFIFNIKGVNDEYQRLSDTIQFAELDTEIKNLINTATPYFVSKILLYLGISLEDYRFLSDKLINKFKDINNLIRLYLDYDNTLIWQYIEINVKKIEGRIVDVKPYQVLSDIYTKIASFTTIDTKVKKQLFELLIAYPNLSEHITTTEDIEAYYKIFKELSAKLEAYNLHKHHLYIDFLFFIILCKKDVFEVDDALKYFETNQFASSSDITFYLLHLIARGIALYTLKVDYMGVPVDETHSILNAIIIIYKSDLTDDEKKQLYSKIKDLSPSVVIYSNDNLNKICNLLTEQEQELYKNYIKRKDFEAVNIDRSSFDIKKYELIHQELSAFVGSNHIQFFGSNDKFIDNQQRVGFACYKYPQVMKELFARYDINAAIDINLCDKIVYADKVTSQFLKNFKITEKNNDIIFYISIFYPDIIAQITDFFIRRAIERDETRNTFYTQIVKQCTKLETMIKNHTHDTIALYGDILWQHIEYKIIPNHRTNPFITLCIEASNTALDFLKLPLIALLNKYPEAVSLYVEKQNEESGMTLEHYIKLLNVDEKLKSLTITDDLLIQDIHYAFALEHPDLLNYITTTKELYTATDSYRLISTAMEELAVFSEIADNIEPIILITLFSTTYDVTSKLIQGLGLLESGAFYKDIKLNNNLLYAKGFRLIADSKLSQNEKGSCYKRLSDLFDQSINLNENIVANLPALIACLHNKYVKDNDYSLSADKRLPHAALNFCNAFLPDCNPLALITSGVYSEEITSLSLPPLYEPIYSVLEAISHPKKPAKFFTQDKLELIAAILNFDFQAQQHTLVDICIHYQRSIIKSPFLEYTFSDVVFNAVKAYIAGEIDTLTYFDRILKAEKAPAFNERS